MWHSKEIALVILFGVIGVVQGVFVVQIAKLLTGLPGINYLLIIFIAIWISLCFLVFQGRRFRAFLANMIFIILTIPTYVMGMPFDLSARIPGILTIVIADIVFNSFYISFRKRNKLLRWIILLSLSFVLLDVGLRVLTYPIFFSAEVVSTFLRITLWLMPVILIETVAGGYVGYKIYQRIKNLTSIDSKLD